MSRKHGGEKYIKSFDGYTHLLTMLYAVIQRFDSLQKIEAYMTAEKRKLHHVGIDEQTPIELYPLRSCEPDNVPFIEAIENY